MLFLLSLNKTYLFNFPNILVIIVKISDQCKEIEENNRMGKTRDLFKKIRDTKGTFHSKMGKIKDRNDMDLTNRSRRYEEEVARTYRRTIQKRSL